MAHSESQSLPISLTRRDPAGVRGDPRFTVVWLAGEHDASTKLALAAVLDRASELDNADVVVDLSGVTFMDASVVGTLIGARNCLAARSLSLHVRAPSLAAARLLALCGLTGLGQAPVKLRLYTTGEAPALATWVDVPAQPTAAGAEADVREPAMSETERGAS